MHAVEAHGEAFDEAATVTALRLLARHAGALSHLSPQQPSSASSSSSSSSAAAAAAADQGQGQVAGGASITGLDQLHGAKPFQSLLSMVSMAAERLPAGAVAEAVEALGRLGVKDQVRVAPHR